MHLRSRATSTRPGRHVLRAKLTRGAEGPKASGRPVGSEPRGAQAGHGGHAPSTHVLRRAEAARSPSRPWTRLRSRREADQITCLRWTDNVHPRPTPRTRAGRGPGPPRAPGVRLPYTAPTPHQPRTSSLGPTPSGAAGGHVCPEGLPGGTRWGSPLLLVSSDTSDGGGRRAELVS